MGRPACDITAAFPQKVSHSIMDIRILEMATRLTEKAMGGQTSGNWIGSPKDVQEFLKATVRTLNDLYQQTPSERTGQY